MADVTLVVHTPRITAAICRGPNDMPETALPADMLEELYDVMGAHGYDPRITYVASISYEVVDLPLLRFEIYVADEHGQPAITDDGDIVIELRDVALRTPLPAWWRPA